MGHLHQHTNYYMLLENKAQSLRVKQYWNHKNSVNLKHFARDTN